MLVREIWKFIHPRVSYFLRATPEGNMILVGEYIFIFPETRMLWMFYYTEWNKKKHIHVKYCWQAYSKSIGTLSHTFKNHIHNSIVAVVCKWCVLSVSDVFLSKNDNSGGKTREAYEGVEYDFYFTEYDCCPVWSLVLIFTHCPIKLIYLWLLIYEV